LLDEIVSAGTIRAEAVYGFFPANSDGDDIVVFTDDSRSHERMRFPMLRQQWEREGQTTFRSLADYLAPVETGRPDYLGAFAVTAGIGADELASRFESEQDPYSAIMTKALADRLAEAFAERLHEQVRREWGYGRGERLSNEQLIREEYRGIRPAAGYPSWPDHAEKARLWQLLGADATTSIRLTESFAMHPASSVSGLYFSHPQATYFAVDLVTRDQVEAYAGRKHVSRTEAERWLAPNLAYEVDS
jgi:5-methyltetrahydrofolate--homocysteine methyltransferase